MSDGFASAKSSVRRCVAAVGMARAACVRRCVSCLMSDRGSRLRFGPGALHHRPAAASQAPARGEPGVPQQAGRSSQTSVSPPCFLPSSDRARSPERQCPATSYTKGEDYADAVFHIAQYRTRYVTARPPTAQSLSPTHPAIFTSSDLAPISSSSSPPHNGQILVAVRIALPRTCRPTPLDRCSLPSPAILTTSGSFAAPLLSAKTQLGPHVRVLQYLLPP